LRSSNGYLTFGGSGTAYLNASIPKPSTPNDFIAPFWDDLNPGAGGGIYYATFGSAPNRQFVVEWNSVPRYSATDPSGGEGALTFEAVLAEGSNDILFQYQTLTGPNATGESATVGIEYSTGASGALYAYNTPGSLQEGMAIRFSPIASGPTPTPAPTCAPTVLSAYYFPIVGK